MWFLRLKGTLLGGSVGGSDWLRLGIEGESGWVDEWVYQERVLLLLKRSKVPGDGMSHVPHTGECLFFSPHCPLPISCTTQLFHPEGRGAANELHFWSPSSRRYRLKPPDLVK